MVIITNCIEGKLGVILLLGLAELGVVFGPGNQAPLLIAELTPSYRRIWPYRDRCQCGDSQDYTTFGADLHHLRSTTRLSGQLAREIMFDCPFALMFFAFFFHI